MLINVVVIVVFLDEAKIIYYYYGLMGIFKIKCLHLLLLLEVNVDNGSISSIMLSIVRVKILLT